MTPDGARKVEAATQLNCPKSLVIARTGCHLRRVSPERLDEAGTSYSLCSSLTFGVTRPSGGPTANYPAMLQGSPGACSRSALTRRKTSFLRRWRRHSPGAGGGPGCSPTVATSDDTARRRRPCTGGGDRDCPCPPAVSTASVGRADWRRGGRRPRRRRLGVTPCDAAARDRTTGSRSWPEESRRYRPGPRAGHACHAPRPAPLPFWSLSGLSSPTLVPLASPVPLWSLQYHSCPSLVSPVPLWSLQSLSGLSSPTLVPLWSLQSRSGPSSSTPVPLWSLKSHCCPALVPYRSGTSPVLLPLWSLQSHSGPSSTASVLLWSP